MKHPLSSFLERFTSLDVGRMFFWLFNRADVHFEIMHLNTEKQLKEGIRADGSAMPDYSEVSVNFYGKPAGRVRLFDTGAFYESFEESRLTEDGFEWRADGQKEDTDLFVRYGDNVIGLTEQSMTDLMAILEPLTEQYLKDELS